MLLRGRVGDPQVTGGPEGRPGNHGAARLLEQVAGDGHVVLERAVRPPLADQPLDAREGVEGALRLAAVDPLDAIQALDLSHGDVDGYALKRRNFVGRHWVRAAGFYPDSVVRLYHRERAAYRPKKAHSSVAAERVEALDAHLSHFTYRDYAHWVERINALSSRDAWAMYERGVKPSAVAPALHAFAAVIRKYLLKGGIFQGLDGATVTITTAFHAYMKYLKLIELHDEKSGR